MLLAIDTSAGTSVAVVDRDRGILAEAGESDTRRHAEVVGELIRICLDQSGVPIDQLSGVVAGMGPGPFTGLRVGIAAANGFALGAGKPVVRVASHDGIAWQHYAAGASGPLLVVTDARRREVYWSAYDGADEFGLPRRVQGPGLVAPGEIAHAVTDYDGFSRLDAVEVSAGASGMLAEGLYQHGRAFASAEPLYLRSPDATVPGAPKRVTG
jgi:tRNA threonylcarbamoyl adenosine modification protein YeaZ